MIQNKERGTRKQLEKETVTKTDHGHKMIQLDFFTRGVTKTDRGLFFQLLLIASLILLFCVAYIAFSTAGVL